MQPRIQSHPHERLEITLAHRPCPAEPRVEIAVRVHEQPA